MLGRDLLLLNYITVTLSYITTVLSKITAKGVFSLLMLFHVPCVAECIFCLFLLSAGLRLGSLQLLFCYSGEIVGRLLKRFEWRW